jgi:polyphosphate kinase
MPKRVLSILIENFEVDEDVVVRTTDRLGYGDWHALYKLHRPALKSPAFTQRTLWAPDETDKVFDQIADQDFLIHHPFDSFTSSKRSSAPPSRIRTSSRSRSRSTASAPTRRWSIC